MAGVGGGVVLATSPGALQVVGGLPLAVRVVLALRAAGVRWVAVLAGTHRSRLATELTRRGVPVSWLSSPEDAGALTEPDSVLVLPGDVLVDETGVARGATCPRAALPRLLSELGNGCTLGDALRDVGGAEARASGEGLFLPLDADHSPAVLDAVLLDHLARRTAVGDSFLAELIDRRLARPVTRVLLGWPVTPSQITLVSTLVGLAGAVGLATVSYAGRLGGVLALIASIVLDCVDGEVARARFEQSAAGARLDVIGDYVVNLATFVGLAIGLARQGLPPAGRWAALFLVGGVAAAMATVHALFIRPALARGGDLHWSGDAVGLRGTRVGTIVEKLASRDYTYLLFAFALIGHLDWFVYAAAGGSWVFVAGLVGYRAFGGAERPRRAAPR